jgi:hypothetical protein
MLRLRKRAVQSRSEADSLGTHVRNSDNDRHDVGQARDQGIEQTARGSS